MAVFRSIGWGVGWVGGGATVNSAGEAVRFEE